MSTYWPAPDLDDEVEVYPPRSKWREAVPWVAAGVMFGLLGVLLLWQGTNP